MEVKDIILKNLTINTGLNAYIFPLVADNDFAMTQAVYDFGIGKIDLAYIKQVEGQYTTQNATGIKTDDDTNSYAAQLTLKFGSFSIIPALMYTKIGKDHEAFEPTIANDELAYHDGTLTNYGMTLNWASGPLTAGASFDYSKGRIKIDYEDAAATDFKGDIATYAIDAIVGFKANDMIKLNAFYTMYSGDNNTADNKINSHIAIMDRFYCAPDGRLYLIDSGSASLHSGVQPFDIGALNNGLMIYGINADITVINNLLLFAQYAYVTAAKKDKATGDNFIGQEIDLSASYKVGPGTSVFIQYGYIFAGDKTFYTDNASEVIVGLTTKL
jgi:predicted porin